MELVYPSRKVEDQCSSLKAARKLFGGSDVLARSLLARINALEQAETLKDIVAMPQFHFHKLKNKGSSKYEGCFAIDVKSRKDAWRIIIQPLDESRSPFVPCNIDEVAAIVRIVEVSEVSKHYE